MQEEYIEGGIPWETVEFVDNLETLSLIEVLILGLRRLPLTCTYPC